MMEIFKNLPKKYYNFRNKMKLKYMLFSGRFIKNLKLEMQIKSKMDFIDIQDNYQNFKFPEKNKQRLEEKDKNIENISEINAEILESKNIIIILLKKIRKLLIIYLVKFYLIIKRILKSEKYFYVRIIIFLVIIIYTFSMKYIYRYIISIIIILWILSYKKIYKNFVYNNKLPKEEQKIMIKYEELCLKYPWFEYIRFLIFLIINRYIYMRRIQRLLILINNILRYIFLKLRIIKYYKYIDEFMYYIIFVYIRLLVEKSSDFTEKIKKKIREKNIKEIIDWRVLVLIINIILIQRILEWLNIDKWVLIIIICMLINIYIIEKTLLYLYYYDNYIVETLYIHFRLKGLLFESGKLPFKVVSDDYHIIVQDKLMRLSENSVFYNGFRQNWVRERWKNHYETDSLSRQNIRLVYYLEDRFCIGSDYFNKYWLNEEVYYDDIIGSINIEKLNELFKYMNFILQQKSALDGDFDVIKDNGVYDKNKKYYQNKYYWDAEQKKILTNYIKSEESYKNIYKFLKKYDERWKKIKKLNDEMYELCKESFGIINEVLELNKQVIRLRTNVLIIKQTELNGFDSELTNYFSELIYNNYRIHNSKYVFNLKVYFIIWLKLSKKLLGLRNKYKEWVEYIYIIENEDRTPWSLRWPSELSLKAKRINLIKDEFEKGEDYYKKKKENEDYDAFAYEEDDEEKEAKEIAFNYSLTNYIYANMDLNEYNTYYMEERKNMIEEIIKDKKNIILEQDVKKTKVLSDGTKAEFITKEEAEKSRKHVKFLSENIGAVSSTLLKGVNVKTINKDSHNKSTGTNKLAEAYKARMLQQEKNNGKKKEDSKD